MAFPYQRLLGAIVVLSLFYGLSQLLHDLEERRTIQKTPAVDIRPFVYPEELPQVGDKAARF